MAKYEPWKNPPSFLRERLHILTACILIAIGIGVLAPVFAVLYQHSDSDILHSFYASADHSNDSVYLVAISKEDVPPFIEYDGDMPTGLDIDIITWIANDAGINIQFVPLATFTDCFEALKNGEVDMFMSGVTITHKRSENFLFSDPYLPSEEQIAVKGENNLTLRDFFLGNGMIGVNAGTSSYDVMHSLFIDPLRVKEINGIVHVIGELMDGNLDFIVTTQPMMAVLSKDHSIRIIGSIFTDEGYGIAFQKNNVTLQKKINTSLKKLLESPEWKEMRLKYQCQQLKHFS